MISQVLQPIYFEGLLKIIHVVSANHAVTTINAFRELWAKLLRNDYFYIVNAIPIDIL
jgi:hypothetical protein